MVGNVWEWTTSDYMVGNAAKVIRGGAWSDTNGNLLPSAHRDYTYPDYQAVDLGFRCAQ
jgi:formylglycine-generating enzyme required for sulfatase activity